MHILLKDRKLPKEEPGNYMLNFPYQISLKSACNMSDPSILSSISSSSLRYSDMTSCSSLSVEPTLSQKDIDQFDIIDSLDYDDIDDNIIDQEIMHQQREALIRKLYDTEKNYLQILDLVLNSFIMPLRKNINKSSLSFLGLRKPPCTEREINWLFSNFEDLHKVHFDNLTSLDDRLSIWGPTQIISDVIQTWFTSLQQQYHIYFDHYDILITTYERLSRYQPFKKFIETIMKNDTLKGTTLLSLLQSPVSCIQRYQDILTTLADNTSQMHPDYIGLMQCKARIQNIAAEFKFKIEDCKNVDQVYNILRVMIGHPFSVKAERRLLYLRNKFSSSSNRSYFLFSDIFVIARRKHSGILQYKGHIVLDRAKVRALTKEDDWSIEISSPFQGVDSLNTTFMVSPTSHIISTYSQEEQTKWILYLKNTIANISQQNKIMINSSKTITSSPTHSIKRQNTITSSSESSTSS
ncbi:Dbl homology domain-containing protein [Cokeromyces recurvatus]|uniref:Dbl homology domain-containing protein n=1 Tax=Cokeromyces recurvatus TaxID=90255 RepID=UPI00221ED5A8|nr:Dbl homology domain-containing protein [Cokeromyces recurvatus]KAI7905093.1 Dbl homology domain-containing protein [Cokeromyces recurvatus]